jgi:hypothetical protein
MPHISGHKKKRKVFDPAEAPSETNRPSGGLVGGTKFDEFRQREKETKGTRPSKARAEVTQENIAETARIKALPGQEELRATAKQEQVDIRAGTIASQEAEVQKGIQFQEEQIEGQSADQGIFLNAAGIIKKVPLVSSAFKLGGKLATSGTELFGIGTQAERDASREWWGGRVTSGDIIGTIGFAGGIALAPTILTAVAPRAAAWFGIRTTGAKGAGGIAFGRGASGKIVLGVGKEGAEKAATRVLALNRTELLATFKTGIGFIKANKGPFLLHQGITFSMAWFAGDNLLFYAGSSIRDISSQVRFGVISTEEAAAELDAAESDMNTARTGFRAAAITNPLLYGLWDLEESAANSIDRNIQRQRKILGII